jgi:hypothetical protein
VPLLDVTSSPVAQHVVTFSTSVNPAAHGQRQRNTLQTGGVVRTGARAEALASALVAAGFSVAARRPPAPRLDALPSDLRAAVVALYRELGGHQEQPVLRPGAWDLALAGGVVVELDEELHFNRYRARTLAEPWAQNLPWRDAYAVMCADREDDCVRAGSWGKRWTSESCERMFGPAAPAARLDVPGGAPRWKQRAFYDAVKDAVAVSCELQVVRLAVHDEISGVSLGALLEGRGRTASRELQELVEQRTA